MLIRPLRTSDIFLMSKIFKKMGIKIETKDKSQEQIGAEILLAVAENFHLAQDEVNELLGNMVGLTAEQFNALPITEVLRIIKEFKSLPGISSFLQQLGQ